MHIPWINSPWRVAWGLACGTFADGMLIRQAGYSSPFRWMVWSRWFQAARQAAHPLAKGLGDLRQCAPYSFLQRTALWEVFQQGKGCQIWQELHGGIGMHACQLAQEVHCAIASFPCLLCAPYTVVHAPTAVIWAICSDIVSVTVFWGTVKA